MYIVEIALGVVALLVVLIVALGIYASTRPSAFRVSRSQFIAAPADAICPHIDSFKKWAAWSPYEKLDPAMKKEFSGAASGPGAVYAWEGNGKAGKGRMEITSETAPTRIEMSLHFDRPFTCDNSVVFTLVPQGDMTEVTWAMHGPQPFMMKVMGIFMNMDRMVGKDFEIGLVNLKALAEK